MITKATPIEMLTFFNYLNSRTEHVNFTMECDPVSISFLDVSVYICDGKLVSKTNGSQYYFKRR